MSRTDSLLALNCICFSFLGIFIGFFVANSGLGFLSRFSHCPVSSTTIQSQKTCAPDSLNSSWPDSKFLLDFFSLPHSFPIVVRKTTLGPPWSLPEHYFDDFFQGRDQIMQTSLRSWRGS